MNILKNLFDNNRKWAEEIKKNEPDFFKKLSLQQSPKYLWIGCSDSRVPANQITGLLPGEVFVHRNVANLVVPNDLNCLSVMQFAVDVLKVEHIIICGHYGCGGVNASIEENKLGLIDDWLQNIKKIYDENKASLDKYSDKKKIQNVLCELNVKQQVVNVCNTKIVKDAWARNQSIIVHGWIYDISDGLLQDLKVSISSTASLLKPLNSK